MSTLAYILFWFGWTWVWIVFCTEYTFLCNLLNSPLHSKIYDVILDPLNHGTIVIVGVLINWINCSFNQNFRDQDHFVFFCWLVVQELGFRAITLKADFFLFILNFCGICWTKSGQLCMWSQAVTVGVFGWAANLAVLFVLLFLWNIEQFDFRWFGQCIVAIVLGFNITFSN